MSLFLFKKFSLKNDNAAMKVGTDGVLLGIWMNLPEEGRMLDIGTGGGVISLIAAQRSETFNVPPRIIAVEIDTPSAKEAFDNFIQSPWKERLTLVGASFEEYCSSFSGERFDLVFSNPPYFIDSLKAPDERRSDARHTDTLSNEEILDALEKILAPKGRIAIVLPTTEAERFISLAKEKGYFLIRLCKVHTTIKKAPSRYLMEFATDASETIKEEHLYIQEGDAFTEQYKELTRDFYIKW